MNYFNDGTLLKKTRLLNHKAVQDIVGAKLYSLHELNIYMCIENKKNLIKQQ